jgi:hypothetical protein
MSDIEVIPITRAAEKHMADLALRKVQFHLDKAKEINDDLAQLLAADNGAPMAAGDQARFAQDENGGLSLLIMRKQEMQDADDGSRGPEADAGSVGDRDGLRDAGGDAADVGGAIQEEADLRERNADVGEAEEPDPA